MLLWYERRNIVGIALVEIILEWSENDLLSMQFVIYGISIFRFKCCQYISK